MTRILVLAIGAFVVYVIAVNVSLRMTGGGEPEPVTFAGGGY